MSAVSRRQFAQSVSVAGLGLLAGCGRLPGQAQPTPRVPRVGYLAPAPGLLEPFRQGLREFGYIEGQNVVLEHRTADESEERLAPLAAELVALPVDVLVAATGLGVRAAMAATTTTPIVGVAIPDVLEGYFDITSLGQPGGNVTGTLNLSAQLSGKRLELLKAAYPRAALVAAFWGAHGPAIAAQRRETETTASVLGLRLLSLTVETGSAFDDAFSIALNGDADALLVADHALMYPNRVRIIDFAARHRLPAMYPARIFVVDGGLFSYGADPRVASRRGGYFVDRILKGAKPADLPVEQPREFDFPINLKTAQTLGLTIPQHVLVQATELIQ